MKPLTHSAPIMQAHTEEPAAPKMAAAASVRPLHISPEILALPGGKGEASPIIKMVLAEVLDLWKPHGLVFARDDHFVNRFGVSKRNIGDALAWLESRGYISRPMDYRAHNKRTLKPGPASVPFLEKSLQDLQELYGSDSRFCMNYMQNLQQLVAEFADINNTLNSTSKQSKKNSESEPVAELRAEAGSAKKEPVQKLPSDESNARAPQTRGARAAAPANQEYLITRAHAPDLSLSDDRFGRWREIPRDAAMVDEYLQERQSPYAGKGQIFFDFYNARGWKMGALRMPCENWVSLISSFRFYEHPDPAPAKARGAYGKPAGSETEQRMSAADEAVAEMMRNL